MGPRPAWASARSRPGGPPTSRLAARTGQSQSRTSITNISLNLNVVISELESTRREAGDLKQNLKKSEMNSSRSRKSK